MSAIVAPTSTPTLSVVIPTYNRRELTARAIDSVLSQAGAENVEVVVVDDGSTDDTLSALRERYAHEPRVRIVATANRGASAARNSGVAVTRAPLIYFLDSDDYVLPGTLRAALRVADENPGVAFVSLEGMRVEAPDVRVVVDQCPGWTAGNFRVEDFRVEPIAFDDAPSVEHSLLVGDFFPAIAGGDLFYLSGLFIRRDAVLGAGPFNERFRYYNDWEFFARLCLQGDGAYVDRVGFCRDSGRADQISHNRTPAAMARRHLYILHGVVRRRPIEAQRYADVLDRSRAAAQYWLGRCLVESHPRRARRYLARSMRNRYKVAKSAVWILRTLLGR